MIYKLLKIIIGLGIRFYYREIRVKNIKQLHTSAPRIIIANHPNTMMDGWLISYISKDPIYFMAKGTFFNSPLKKWLLKGLGLIPINRSTDASTKGISNTDSFEACYRLLEEGKTVVIFPEGNSFKEHQLRELKSGTARIALEVERRGLLKSNLEIVPVGLVYSKAEKFRSSVLVSVGEPISAKPHLELFKENSSKAARELTAVFKEKLSVLLVNATTNNYDELVDDLVALFGTRKMRLRRKGMENNVTFLREINSIINEMRTSDPKRLEQIKTTAAELKVKLEALQIVPAFLDRTYRSTMFIRQLIQSTLALVVGLPFFLFGFVHNVVPYKVMDILVLKLVKDVEYYAPVSVLMGLVFYPLNYFGFLYLIDFAVDLSFWQKFIYFFSMPVFGLFAFQFYLYYNHISVKTNFVILMKTERGEIEKLKKEKEALGELLFTSNTPG